MTEIKIAQKEHLSDISEIEKMCFSEPWSENALELFIKDGAFAAVCIIDGRVRSYCTVIQALDEAQIVNVATHPTSRGRGYARSVIERVIEESRARSITSVSLEVRVSNVSAIGLYTSFGFEICGVRKGFYKNPKEDAYVMVKKIRRTV